jgi:hypothetical protein
MNKLKHFYFKYYNRALILLLFLSMFDLLLFKGSVIFITFIYLLGLFMPIKDQYKKPHIEIPIRGFFIIILFSCLVFIYNGVYYFN